MSHIELSSIIATADLIAGGYAFTLRDDGRVSVLHVEQPHHAALLSPAGEVLETNMDDIELDIVLNHYWAINKKYLPQYA